MKRLLHIAAVAVAAAIPGPAAAAGPTPKKVLYFTKSSAFEHSVVKRRGSQPSFSEQVLAEFGPRHGIEFTFSKDGSRFNREYLAQFDAVMFYTSGDLLAAGRDGHPPLSAEGKAALLEAVASGRLGFVGLHSAADTFHTGETTATNTDQPRTWRYRTLGAAADPYLRMLGGELIVHGTQQIARATVVDPGFPGLGGLGHQLELMEEWYSLTEFADDLRVLLRLETAGMRDPNANGTDWPPVGWDTPYRRPPYPNTWARLHGQGRVFYTALGHREDVWLSAAFEQILSGGLDWVLRRTEADVTPNLATTTPGARELPPVSGPVAGLPKGLRNAPPPPIPPRP